MVNKNAMNEGLAERALAFEAALQPKAMVIVSAIVKYLLAVFTLLIFVEQGIEEIGVGENDEEEKHYHY